MRVETHLNYINLTAETLLEGELLKKWFQRQCCTSSASYSNARVTDLSISFTEEKLYANTQGQTSPAEIPEGLEQAPKRNPKRKVRKTKSRAHPHRYRHRD